MRKKLDRTERKPFENIFLKFDLLVNQRAYFSGNDGKLNVIASVNVGRHPTFKFDSQDVFTLPMREWSTVQCRERGRLVFEELTE